MGMPQEADHPCPEVSSGSGSSSQARSPSGSRTATSSRVRPAQDRGSGPARSVDRGRQAGGVRGHAGPPGRAGAGDVNPAEHVGQPLRSANAGRVQRFVEAKAARRVAAVAALRTSSSRSTVMGRGGEAALDHPPLGCSGAPRDRWRRRVDGTVAP